MTTPRGTYGGGYYAAPSFPDTPIYDSLVAERGTPQIAPIRVPALYDTGSHLPALPALPALASGPSPHTPAQGVHSGYQQQGYQQGGQQQGYQQQGGYQQQQPLQYAPAPYIPQQASVSRGYNGGGYQTQPPYQGGQNAYEQPRPQTPRPVPPRQVPGGYNPNQNY